MVGVLVIVGAAWAQDICGDIERVGQLAQQHQLDDATLRTLFDQYCTGGRAAALPPASSTTASLACRKMIMMEKLARIQGADRTIVDQIAEQRQAVCDGGPAAEIPSSWSTGITLQTVDGGLRYPNAVAARKPDGTWHYPNAVMARTPDGTWQYPTAVTARRPDGVWQRPDVETVGDAAAFLSWACAVVGYEVCDAQRGDLDAPDSTWRQLTVLGLGWQAGGRR